jgi:hypothetical protein
LVEVGRRWRGRSCSEPVGVEPRGPGPPLNPLRAHGVGGCGVMSPGAESGCVNGRVALVGSWVSDQFAN